MKFKLDLAVKPYANCLSCKYRKVRCNGISPSSMDLLTWSAYMRDIKEHDKLTNAYVADKSSVSIKTIERIMALNCDQDIMRDTARRIESVVLGAENQHTCHLMLEGNAPAETTKLIDGIHSSYAAEMKIIREEAKIQIERLRSEVDYLRAENEQKSKIIEKLLDK